MGVRVICQTTHWAFRMVYLFFSMHRDSLLALLLFLSSYSL